MSRQLKPSGKGGERKFLDQATMNMIRWDVSIVNSCLRRQGQKTTRYVSLYPLGCGCCFHHVIDQTAAPTPVPKAPPEMEFYQGAFTDGVKRRLRRLS